MGVWSMVSKQRQPATGYRPSGRQCAECQHAAEDCSRLDFASMPPAGKRDSDGVQRVACSYYVRAGEAGQHPNSTGHAHAGAALLQILGSALESADEFEHPCCGALASGPHKMGCSQRTDRAPQFPATRDAGGVVTVCQRPCRCGPDGCADSVACPRHNRSDG